MLIGLWATGLVVGFSLIDWGIRAAATSPNNSPVYGSYLYMSGTTFFTLGVVDIIPKTALGRFAVVLEGGIGFIFLAVVISYLPVLYQTFARREKTITALYARAGTPPSATAILCRYAGYQHMEALASLLDQWEDWATELLETYLSYPMLALYRSHHEGESGSPPYL